MFDSLIKEFVQQYGNENWQSVLIVSILILISAFIAHFVLFRILKRSGKKRGKLLIQNIYSRFKIPALLFLLTIALYIILSSFAPDNQLISYFKHFLNLLIIFTITWLIICFTGLGKNIILKQYNLKKKDNLKARRIHTQLRLIERILNFVIILIALAIALTTFDSIRKVGISLFASAGIAGIILGFAAQKMLGTVLAGFQIAITQPIRIDDVVIVENEWGWIEEITLTYVVVKIWDKRRLILPTTYFIDKPFQNWTRTNSAILGTVYVYADYTVPFNKLRKELTRILESDKNWDGEVNVLQVTNATEKTVEVRALMSAEDSPKAWDLRVNVREKLIEYLQRYYPESLPQTRIMIDNKSQPRK